MKWTTHRAFGVATSMVVGEYYLHMDIASVEGMIFLATTYVFSTIPDRDFDLGMEHRGVSHSLLALSVVSYFFKVLAYFLQPIFPYANIIPTGVFLGY